MIKKRRRTDEPLGASEDSNEQVLAAYYKDAELIADRSTGRDNRVAESLPENIEGDTEKKKQDKTAELSAPEERPLLCEGKTSEQQEKQTQEPKAQSPKQRRRGGGIYIGIMAGCLILSIALLAFAYFERRDNEYIIPPADSHESEQSAPESTETKGKPMSAADIYAKYAESTVTVIRETNGEKSYYTGFALFDGTYIATLAEALLGDGVSVLNADGQRLSVQKTRLESTVNLALLKIEGATLEPLCVASAASLCAGDGVFAIANIANGRYTSSLLAGNVAYAQRQTEILFPDSKTRRTSVIQLTSLGANGLEGCPVFDKNGNAIGLTLSLEEAGATLVLPLERAMSVFEVLKGEGSVSAQLLADIAYAAPRLGILGEQGELDGAYGVYVKGFDDGSDAAKKLRLDDFIYKIDETPTPDSASVAAILDKRRAGEHVEVFVRRGSQSMSFFVTLYD